MALVSTEELGVFVVIALTALSVPVPEPARIWSDLVRFHMQDVNPGAQRLGGWLLVMEVAGTVIGRNKLKLLLYTLLINEDRMESSHFLLSCQHILWID